MHDTGYRVIDRRYRSNLLGGHERGRAYTVLDEQPSHVQGPKDVQGMQFEKRYSRRA